MENVFKKIIIKAIKESVIINSVICDIVVTVQISAQSLKKKKKSDFESFLRVVIHTEGQLLRTYSRIPKQF